MVMGAFTDLTKWYDMQKQEQWVYFAIGGKIMTEYFKVETEPTADPDVLEIITSEMLTDEEEVYHTVEEGDVGSPIAQALFSAVDGIRALSIIDDTLIITRDPDIPWEVLVDEVRDVLRDFFL